MGVTAEQLADLGRYRESPVFSETERLVLDLAVEMVKTPVELSDDLLARLRASFDDREMVELVATLAWENYRARFNRVFRVEAAGFSEGAACALPERGLTTAR